MHFTEGCMLSFLPQLMSRTVCSQGFKLCTGKGELPPDEGRRIVAGCANPPRARQDRCWLFIALWGNSFLWLKELSSKNTSRDKISTLLCCPLYSPALMPITFP